MASVTKKLMEVQSELKAPKGQFNSFGKYKYRSCEDILEAVKPILAKHGAVIELSDEIEVIGERYYIKATAYFRDIDSDIAISATAYAREAKEKKGMDESQITGMASSYARKYALNGLLLIDDSKDADTDEAQGGKPAEKQEEKKVETIPEAKVSALISKCEKEGVDIQKLCKAYKVKKLPDLTEKMFVNIIENWQQILETLK